MLTESDPTTLPEAVAPSLDEEVIDRLRATEIITLVRGSWSC
ncbi:MAG: hypothetical protein R3C49_10055 [Planctomycetaceae bacterium]